MEEYTQEELDRHVSAAYDSVTVIDELEAKETLTSEETDSLDRNKRHLEIMLAKDWFDGHLTDAQRTELTTKSQ